jgi:hypothetical protein
MDQAEQAKKMSQLVAKCWSDESFKRKLLADPAATLRAEGVPLEVPAGVSVKALENTEKCFISSFRRSRRSCRKPSWKKCQVDFLIFASLARGGDVN